MAMKKKRRPVRGFEPVPWGVWADRMKSVEDYNKQYLAADNCPLSRCTSGSNRRLRTALAQLQQTK